MRKGTEGVQKTPRWLGNLLAGRDCPPSRTCVQKDDLVDDNVARVNLKLGQLLGDCFLNCDLNTSLVPCQRPTIFSSHATVWHYYN